MFWEISLVFLMFYDLVVQVSAICIVHYNAQTTRQVIKECFLVTNYELILNRCKNSDFIKRIDLLFLRQFLHFDLQILLL